MTDLRRSRPARQAAHATGASEAEALARLDGTVVVALDDALSDDPDARETFLFAVNQCLRFAGRVGVSTISYELATGAEELALAITGSPLAVVDDADVTLVVGTRVARDHSAVTVSSSGWVARLATSGSGIDELPHPTAPPNALGALAAACLGASQVFHHLVGLERAEPSVELSLWSLEQGPLGSLATGPALPNHLELDSLLVGCGGVMHGFVYALQRLAAGGRARAIDRQRLRDENIGPYVLARLDQLGWTKTAVVKTALPGMDVQTHDEELYPLFTTRLDRGLITLPPVVVAGLDRVRPRHIAQRLWPELLVDLGSGGETSQVIIKRLADDGACVLELLDLAAGEADAHTSELGRLAAESGLSPESLRDAMDAPIDADDVARAPKHLRADMEAARQRGQLRCGYVRSRALDHESDDEDFVAAAPFVVAFAGVAGCAQLIRALESEQRSLRYQFSFSSLRGRVTTAIAREDCDCCATGITAGGADASESR